MSVPALSLLPFSCIPPPTASLQKKKKNTPQKQKPPQIPNSLKARGPFEVSPLQTSEGRSKGPPGSPKPKCFSLDSPVLLPHTIESDHNLPAIKSVPGRKCEIRTGNGSQYKATLPSPPPLRPSLLSCPAPGLGAGRRRKGRGHFQLWPHLLLFYQVVLDLAPLNCA